MSFLDKLEIDAYRVHFGAKTFEEDLVYAPISGSPSPVRVKGIVEIDSLNTGAGAEVEINPSISSLAFIYFPSLFFTITPEIYDEITQSRYGITWVVKQKDREEGLWKLTCTANPTRRRGRVR
jgi:hypothetical protein